MPGMRTPAGIGTGRRFRHDELWEKRLSGESGLYKRTNPVFLRSS
jgi:hypothetical protein